jgi:hypothetical protein
VVDVDSVEKEVFANVVGKGLWAVECRHHSLELLELINVF